jgi:hypothetical protein
VDKKIISGSLIVFLFVLSPVFASPVLQIHSPQNITYSQYTHILVNISSSEPVDFFVVSRSGKHVILAPDATSFTSSIYGSLGTYDFSISANNSNGTASAEVNFSINHSSIINVTECGFEISPNTTYVLQNDIASSGGSCINFYGHDFVIDLNGYTVSGEPYAIFGDCLNSEIKNGKITSNGVGAYVSGNKCHLANLTIDAGNGMLLEYMAYSVLEDIAINNTNIAIDLEPESHNIVMRNLTLTAGQYGGVAFYDANYYSSVILENSSATNFTYDMRFNVESSDWYFKNNKIRLDSIHPYSTIYGRARLFKMHLLKVNVTDQDGNGIASSVELVDNGILPRTGEEENMYTLNSNPTGRVLIGTDENGTASYYVTEKLIVYKTQSPLSSEEYEFSPYTFTARSGKSFQTVGNISLNINSTFETDFTINLGSSGLPQCTLAQMLDLDNNGVVNSKDAQVILRYMVGKDVSINSTKQCNALNFNPVHG